MEANRTGFWSTKTWQPFGIREWMCAQWMITASDLAGHIKRFMHILFSSSTSWYVSGRFWRDIMVVHALGLTARDQFQYKVTAYKFSKPHSRGWMFVIPNEIYCPDILKHPLLSIWRGLIIIPAWIRNCIHYKIWDEITYPFSHFNGCLVEVSERISNFAPYFTGPIIIHSCYDYMKLIHVNKMGPSIKD